MDVGVGAVVDVVHVECQRPSSYVFVEDVEREVDLGVDVALMDVLFGVGDVLLGRPVW